MDGEREEQDGSAAAAVHRLALNGVPVFKQARPPPYPPLRIVTQSHADLTFTLKIYCQMPRIHLLEVKARLVGKTRFREREQSSATEVSRRWWLSTIHQRRLTLMPNDSSLSFLRRLPVRLS